LKHEEAEENLNIALVGKYVELEDAYYSVRESLCHAGLYNDRNINYTLDTIEILKKASIRTRSLQCMALSYRADSATAASRE